MVEPLLAIGSLGAAVRKKKLRHVFGLFPDHGVSVLGPMFDIDVQVRGFRLLDHAGIEIDATINSSHIIDQSVVPTGGR